MRTIVRLMKKLIPIIVAFAIVAILVTVKVKRGSTAPEAPEGAWEPVDNDSAQ